MDSPLRDMGKDDILRVISNFGWWLYVIVAWRKNHIVQRKLDADVRDNLAYYLRESNPDFKNL